MLYIELEKAHVKQHIRHNHNGGLIIVHDHTRRHSSVSASLSAPPVVNDFRAGTKSHFIMELLMAGRWTLDQIVAEADQKFGGSNLATVKLFMGDLQKPKGKYSASRGLTLTTDSSGCVSIVEHHSDKTPAPEPPKQTPDPQPEAKSKLFTHSVEQIPLQEYLDLTMVSYAKDNVYSDRRKPWDITDIRKMHRQAVWQAMQRGAEVYVGWESDYPEFVVKPQPTPAPKTNRPGLIVVNSDGMPAPKAFINTMSYGTASFRLGEEQVLAANLALSAFEKGSEGFMLADGTGVGKTATMLATAAEYAKLHPTEHVCIITINKQVVAGSFASDAKSLGIDMSKLEIGTYDDLKAGKIGQKSYGLVVFDEAHQLKNPESARFMVGQKVPAKHRLFATATPMDRPTAAPYFMAHITGKTEAEIQDELGYHVTEVLKPNGDFDRFKIELNQGMSWPKIMKNLLAMRDQAIKVGKMIRREYPFYGQVEMDEFQITDPRLARYEQAISGFYDSLANWAENKGRYDLVGVYKQNRAMELRRLLEPFKLDYYYDRMKSDLAAGRQVIIMAEGINDTHLQGLTGLADPGFEHVVTDGGKSAIKWPGFLGEMAKKLKADGIEFAKIYDGGNGAKSGGVAGEVAKFQAGQIQVALATPGSGGTGINLGDVVGNLPRSLYMVTPNFSGDVFDQVIGRVSRRNTASPAYVGIGTSNGMADAHGAKILAKKRMILKAIQAGEDPDTAKGINLTGIRDNDITGGDTGRSGPVTSTKVSTGSKVALQIHDNPKNPNLVTIKGDTFKHKDSIKDVLVALGSKATWNGADGWDVPKALVTLIMNHSKLSAAFGINKSMLTDYRPATDIVKGVSAWHLTPIKSFLVIDLEKSHVRATTVKTAHGIVQRKAYDDKRTKKVDIHEREGKDVHEEHTNVAEVEDPRIGITGKSDDDLRLIAKERNIYIPPAWTNLWVNSNQAGELQVTGVDKKGKTQYVYSPEHTGKAAEKKFLRLKDFTAQYGKMLTRIKKDMATVEEAKVLYLISQTAFRIGSERDTKAEKKAYGASTLQSDHYNVGEGGSVKFDFIGKEGVNIKQEVTDTTLASMLKGKSGKTFNTTDAKVRKYLKKAGFGQFDPKDFRTYIATSMALRLIHSMPAPTDEATHKRAVNDVCKAVSAKLNNTPKMAKNSYIAPEVWDQWVTGGTDGQK
jgi:DNA topoisomerase-1